MRDAYIFNKIVSQSHEGIETIELTEDGDDNTRMRSPRSKPAAAVFLNWGDDASEGEKNNLALRPERTKNKKFDDDDDDGPLIVELD